MKRAILQRASTCLGERENVIDNPVAEQVCARVFDPILLSVYGLSSLSHVSCIFVCTSRTTIFVSIVTPVGFAILHCVVAA